MAAAIPSRVSVAPGCPVGGLNFNIRGSNPGVEPHLHQLPELGYCYEGSGIFVVNGRVFPFRAGDAFIVGAGDIHIARGDDADRARCGWIYFDPEFLAGRTAGDALPPLRLDDGAGRKNFTNVIAGTVHPEMAHLIREVIHEAGENNERRINIIWIRLLLLLELLEKAFPLPPGEGDEHLPSEINGLSIQRYRELERLKPAMEQIGKSFRQHIEIKDLAGKCFTSEANFRKLFHRVFSCSPREYISRLRLNLAASILKNSPDPVSQIAEKCGFYNISNFNRQFQHHFGCSPRQYRQGIKGDNN